MIKVIDGKRYNTDTAEEVYSHYTGQYGDFDYRERTLYRTKAGAWFMYHAGGALTDMAVVTSGNDRTGSTAIEPVSDDQAYAFLERHSADDEALAVLERYFGDRVQDA
ncbi:hypothetical protein [Heyndrickxia coagulans]|uniref:Uncharacterized protein n=1 Tax=Heyndrickxia coagulans TaxID=1398 RepID=A0A150K6K4_HEYCO|nr:hypothetical protein [Heyndrickxia coagulans]KYC65207.1 hypothetical protein B4099_0353 [Heyndrickxia coagulans]